MQMQEDFWRLRAKPLEHRPRPVMIFEYPADRRMGGVASDEGLSNEMIALQEAQEVCSERYIQRFFYISLMVLAGLKWRLVPLRT